MSRRGLGGGQPDFSSCLSATFAGCGGRGLGCHGRASGSVGRASVWVGCTSGCHARASGCIGRVSIGVGRVSVGVGRASGSGERSSGRDGRRSACTGRRSTGERRRSGCGSDRAARTPLSFDSRSRLVNSAARRSHAGFAFGANSSDSSSGMTKSDALEMGCGVTREAALFAGGEPVGIAGPRFVRRALAGCPNTTLRARPPLERTTGV